MKIIFNLIILLSITTLSCGSGEQSSNEDDAPIDADVSEVKDAFNNYKNAILNDAGEGVLEFVDSRTKAYYSEILEITKSVDSTELTTLNLIDRMMVFTIRNKVSKVDILSLDGKGLFVYAVKEGMVGKNGVVNISIGEVNISENFATGEVLNKGTKTPINFHFYFEENKWKIDLTSSFPVANMALKNVIDESGMNENEYIFMLLEMMTGKPVVSDIWYPVQ